MAKIVKKESRRGGVKAGSAGVKAFDSIGSIFLSIRSMLRPRVVVDRPKNRYENHKKLFQHQASTRDISKVAEKYENNSSHSAKTI